MDYTWCGGAGPHAANARGAAASTSTTSEAVGTSGRTAGSEVTSVATLANGTQDLVGRRVNLDNVKVTRTDPQSGFWIGSGGTNVLVISDTRATKSGAAARSVGQSVSIEGTVLQMPRPMRQRAEAASANDQIYVYARSVK
jgi:hypothetical protein